MNDTENMPPRTLFDKIWDSHVVAAPEGQSALLYVDLHLVHEVTSPQVFDGLRADGRRLRQPLRTVATADHNIPTTPRGLPIADPITAKQIEALQKNCRAFGVPLFDMDGRGFAVTFAMDDFLRHCLLNGLDDIGLTLQHEAEITAYEEKHPVCAEMKSLATVL